MISAALVVGTAITVCNADLIELKSGGRIRGKISRISRKNGVPARSEIKIETLAGTVVVVKRDDVRKISRRPLLVEEYEIRANDTPDEADAQWELAEWCRENRLAKQRKRHLQKVVERDSNHEQAHLALNHRFRKGRWISRDDEMRAQGYVKHKRRYVTTQALDRMNKSEIQRKRERDWRRRIRQWHTWLNNRDPARRNNGWKSLTRITDPDAVQALVRHFQDSPDEELRKLYINILSQIPGGKPVAPLVVQTLHDVSLDLRKKSFAAIQPNRHDLAVPHFVPELNHRSNIIVRRAAVALGKLGDDSVFLDLVDALVTTHRYRVRIPDNRGMTFGSNGSFSTTSPGMTLPPNIELMARTGQFPDGIIVLPPANQPVKTRVITITREHENGEVVEALQKLTGESFGFNRRAWRLWWTRQKNGAANVFARP